jgi:hypothetical protein
MAFESIAPKKLGDLPAKAVRAAVKAALHEFRAHGWFSPKGLHEAESLIGPAVPRPAPRKEAEKVFRHRRDKGDIHECR